ncbi:MAG: hypothetical protein QE273_16430 [Verrucomicrobiales bacterium]|nr:hypothetical protein [Verrucomicrobiales bacterium]
MKNHLYIHGVFASLLAIASLTSAKADDSVIALGAVDILGGLDKSANSVGGIVSSSLSATGDFQVTVTAAGAFAGATLDDFIVETTVRSLFSDDNGSNGAVTAVTDDVLTVRVRTADLEDDTNPDGPFAQNSAFYFVVRRIDVGTTSIEGDSRFLLGVGQVSSIGALLSEFGVDGVTVISSKINTGEYTISLTKAGGFVGDVIDDYVIMLCPDGGTAADDEAVRGGASSVASNDAVVFEVYTDDVQQAVAGNSPVPTDEPFSFAIYRLTGAETTDGSASRMVTAVAAVSSIGDPVTGATRFGDGTLSASRISAGLFQLDLANPGAFAGVAAGRFVVQAFSDSSASIDELIGAEVNVLNDDTLRVRISATDVEVDGQATGTLNDRNLFVVIYDTEPDFGPDLSIGTKKSLTTLKGRGVQNANGAGQGIKLNLTGTAERKFFLAAENTGHSIDGIRLKGIGTAGPLNTSFFRTTGGKTNVTAEVKIGAVVAEDVFAGEIIRFEGRSAYRSATTRPTKTMKVRGLSGFEPSSIDLVKAKVVAK